MARPTIPLGAEASQNEVIAASRSVVPRNHPTLHAAIVDRISAGIERRAKEGRWFGGRPPFGYVFSNEERVLVPDPVEAPVVRRMFDLYARKRLGTRTIAQLLHDEGAPAPSAGWGDPAVH